MRLQRRGSTGAGWCILLLLVAAVQAQDFPNLLTAMRQLNCTALLSFLQLYGMQSEYENATTQVVLLLPPNAAYLATPDTILNSAGAQALQDHLSLHSLPLSAPGGVLPLTDGVTLPTLLPAKAGRLGNLTFRVLPDPSQVWYVGGLPSGGYVNTAQSWTAGQSRVYLVDALLRAPDTTLKPSVTAGLSMVQTLGAMDPQQVGTMYTLIQADPALRGYCGNVDLAATLFVPTNSALQRLMTRLNVTLAQFANSTAARAVVQAHVLPDRPWASALLPSGTSTIASWEFEGVHTDVTVTVARDTQNKTVITASSVGNVQPITITQADIPAGKSVMHLMNDVILTATVPGLPTSSAPAPLSSPPQASAPTPAQNLLPTDDPSVVSATTTPPAPPDASSSSSSSSLSVSKVGAILAGVLCGFFALKLACFGGYLLYRRKQRKRRDFRLAHWASEGLALSPAQRSMDAKPKVGVLDVEEGADIGTQHDGEGRGGGGRAGGGGGGAMPPGGEGDEGGMGAAAVVAAAMDNAAPGVHVQGFIYGDPFVRSTAPQYSWTDLPSEVSLPGVEAGLNDLALDQALSSNGTSPVVRLSRSDVVKQIRLLRNGLLGRGSSALVFKCQWPSRFGPHALLAIKVLKDPYQSDPTLFETFCYEAAVLATVRHPNVVRIFGYCLELPTACIIMELLPATLKDKLYKHTPTHSGGRTAAPSADTSDGAGGDINDSVGSKGVPSEASSRNRNLSSGSSAQYASASQQPHVVRTPSISTPVKPRISVGSPSVHASAGPSAPVSASALQALHAAQVHAATAAALAARQRQRSSQGSAHTSSTPTPTPTAITRQEATPTGRSSTASAHTPESSASTLHHLPSTPSLHSGQESSSKLMIVQGSSPALSPSTPRHNTAAAAAAKGARWWNATSTNSRDSRDKPARTRLSMAEVLRISADIAAGLAYLHKRPAVLKLPAHPTLALEMAGEAPSVAGMPEFAKASMRAHSFSSRIEEEQEEEEESKTVARIVHRDLKPSNVLLNSAGTAKITDFGLARWHNNSTVHTGKLGVGTLRYMAPELLLGHYSGPDAPSMTNRVDIYSLGMLMWEMASAQMPWSDMTDAQIVASVISRQRPTIDGPPAELTEPSIDLSASTGLPALLRTLARPTPLPPPAPATPAGAANAPTTPGSPALPTNLSNFPALQAVITCCWQQRDAKRPTARTVHKALATLLQTYGR